MKIENVIKKFNQEKIYLCPKCLSESCIENISLVCRNNHRYDFSKKGYIHLINNYKPTKYSEELFKARSEVFGNDFYENVLKNVQSLVEKHYLTNRGLFFTFMLLKDNEMLCVRMKKRKVF